MEELQQILGQTSESKTIQESIVTWKKALQEKSQQIIKSIWE